MTRFPTYVVTQHVIDECGLLQRLRWNSNHLVSGACVVLGVTVEALVSKIDYHNDTLHLLLMVFAHC